MSINTKNETIGASGQTLLESANTMFLFSASANVSLLFQVLSGGPGGGVGGGNESFVNMPAGFYVNRVRPWGKCIVSGAPGTTFQMFYGYETHREDETLFQTTIAVVSGAVATSPGTGSSGGGNNTADLSVPGSTFQTNAIAANPARKSIIVGNLSTNVLATPSPIRLQWGAGVNANEGIELQPGTFIVLPSTSGFSFFNGDTAAQKVWWSEML